MNLDKWIHLVALIISALSAGVAVFAIPELTKDASTTLGTIGFFATAYGVLFAIIELRRAQTASRLARNEAKRVFNALTNLVVAREIIECQSSIHMAFESLDKERFIPTTILYKIIRIYSQVFYNQLADGRSEHRKNRSIVQSYSYNTNSSKTRVSAVRTKQALFSMTSHLAELQGSTKNFTEYTNDS